MADDPFTRWKAWWSRWEFVTPLVSVMLVAILFVIAATQILARKEPPRTIASEVVRTDAKGAQTTTKEDTPLEQLCTDGVHAARDTFDAYKSGMIWGVAVTMLLFGGILLIAQSVYLYLLACSKAYGWRRAIVSALFLYPALLVLAFLCFRNPPLASDEVNQLIARCIPRDLWTFPYINTLIAFGVMCAAISAATTLAGHDPQPPDDVVAQQVSRLRWVLYIGGFVETFAVFEVASLYTLIQNVSGASANDFASLSEGAVIAAAFTSSAFLFAIYVPAAWRLRQRAGKIDESKPIERFQQVLAMAAPVLSTIPITSSLGLFGLH